MPLFEGSRESRSQPVLGLEMTYRSENLGSVAMGSRGIVWTLRHGDGLGASIGLRNDPGRVDDGNRKFASAGYPGQAACCTTRPTAR